MLRLKNPFPNPLANLWLVQVVVSPRSTLSRPSNVRHGRSFDAVLTFAVMTRGNVRRSATRLLRALAQPNATAEQSPALLPVFDICNGRAASRANLSSLAGGPRLPYSLTVMSVRVQASISATRCPPCPSRCSWLSFAGRLAFVAAGRRYGVFRQQRRPSHQRREPAAERRVCAAPQQRPTGDCSDTFMLAGIKHTVVANAPACAPLEPSACHTGSMT